MAGGSGRAYPRDDDHCRDGRQRKHAAFRRLGHCPASSGAGAAQTMMNLHGVKPGENILMVGSGNVGLVVGYQLLQAGCTLKAVIDAAPRVGGYGVPRRQGCPDRRPPCT